MALHFVKLGGGILLATLLIVASASDPSPLQDFCVADPTSPVVVNGLACKDPNLVRASDFFFSGLHLRANTTNSFGAGATPVTAAQIPALNTLGISMGRVDFAPQGLSPPHIHPRATEILIVLDGRIEAGFITSNPENRLVTKVLEKGDVFVFPEGLIHFQRNIGNGNAVAVAYFSNQNIGGIIFVANDVFGSNPAIPADVLAKAFQVDQNIISKIASKF
ncbi:putative germin-like protein 2-1 [Ipomoea triloba]|uniref:putative germin-like protein 2-1 n=1 Tax=Ipomoea triloba TaxID=35885 RepID=UPI00125E5517|nr:putative germin-like protein 2-1 [Ipomoea triloba]GLL31439.1 putative germin-like protein 2-1 [Ipomoea trifida]